jgi:hypothetical protein
VTRAQLEHIIRAACTIVDDEDLIVIGSQSVLGEFPDAPAELRISREADVYPRRYPERADLIDSTIGEDSPFDRAFGYYAHGVGPETAVLPEGWRDRLVLVSGENTRFVRGWCLETHDLAISKYVAGRDKDLTFTAALIRHGMVDRGTLEGRLEATPLESAMRDLARSQIARQFHDRQPRSDIG